MSSCPEAAENTRTERSRPLTVTPELVAAFTQAVAERRAQLVGLAQRITLSRQDAEDVVQESALLGLRNLSGYRGEARLDTWLHAIVLNTARSWRRSRGRHVHVPLELESSSEPESVRWNFPHPGKSPEESCSEQHMRALLLAEIASLEPMYRRPIQFCDLEERSYRDAAAALNLNLCTLKARLFRGRAVLRRKLRHLARTRERPH
jgi:RNA polymerase sigma-70 factor (ECF subfamily)